MPVFAYIIGTLGVVALLTYTSRQSQRPPGPKDRPSMEPTPAPQNQPAAESAGDPGPESQQPRAYEGELDPAGRRAALPKQPEAVSLPRVGQKTITESLYRAIADGNPYPFKDISDAAGSLDLLSQVYIAAALVAAKPRIEELQRSINDTIGQFQAIAAKVAEFNNKLGGIVNGIGQVIGSLGAGGQLAAGLGKIGTSIISIGLTEPTTLDYLKSRLSDLSWLRDWEGADCYRGLRLQEKNQPFSRTKRRIEADPIANSLPEVTKGEQFWFCPSLEQFQEIGIKAGAYSPERFSAATALGLSEIWARPEEDRPVDAYQVQDYTLGYQQAQNGIEQTSEAKFYLVGRADAINGKPSQVLPALGLWSQNRLGNG